MNRAHSFTYLSFILLAFLFSPGVSYRVFSQNHPNGVDFIGPDGMVYPDVTFAGVQGGIPNLPVVATVQKGTGNDYQAILNAVEAANAAGGGAVLIPNGVYELHDHVKIRYSNIVLRGQSRTGTVIHCKTSKESKGFIYFLGGGLTGPRQMLVADAARGSKRLYLNPAEIVSKASFYQPGKWVRAQVSVEPPEFQGKFKLSPTYTFLRDLYEVVELTAQYVEINQPIRENFTVAQGARLEPCNIIERVGVENLTILSDNVGHAAHGVQFDYVVNGWLKEVDVITPPSYPVNYSYAKHIEIRDCFFRDPWRQGGGGMGYGGFLAAFDCLWIRTNTLNMRHAPLVQAYTAGCVFTESEFVNSDAHWHLGWARENIFENCVITKGSSGKPYVMECPEPDNGMHEPVGHMNVVYNCDVHGGRWGTGLRLGAMVVDWVFAHNRIHSPLFKAPPTKSLINIYDNAANTYFFNNVFYTNNLDPLNNSAFAMFLPGYVHGFGQTGNYVHESVSNPWPNPTAESQPVASSAEVHFIGNKVYGIKPGREFVGMAEPATDADNEFFETFATTPERPEAPVESIWQWQVALKTAQLSGGGSLPYTLGRFEARAEATEIHLSWETSQETNASHFVVERSEDGLLYASIGRVEAQNKAAAYQFADTDPLANVKYYYRLKMTDLDGQFEYSRRAEAVIQQMPSMQVLMGPVPVQELLSVQVFRPEDKTLRVEVLDVSGRTIAAGQINGVGWQRIDFPRSQLSSTFGMGWVVIKDQETVLFSRSMVLQ